MIDLRRQQVVEHVHGGGEQDTLIRLAGAPADDLRQEGLTHAGVADEDGAGAFGDELQIEQTKNPRLQLQTAFVMLEVEAVNGVTDVQPGETEAALDGTA